jgi:thiamine pyrophosphate-dependent acetolactate synthase large subunit-like protein
MPRKMHGTDFIQTTEPDLLFRDVSLYTETVSSAAQAPAVIHQAIAAAYAGRGVAHLTLPQDVVAARADGGVDSIATLRPRPGLAASAADIAEIVRRIDEADSVVIMCGAGCRGSAEELRALSDRLRAPLIHTVKGKEILPYDDPRWMGGIGMIGTKPVYNAVMHCDVLLMLGTDYPYSEFLPRKSSVIQVDDRQHVLGRRAPTALGVLGSVRPTVKLLVDKVASKTDSEFLDRVTKERRKWDEMLDKQADPARSRDRIHPQAVARAVSDLAKDDAVFVIDTGLNTLWSANWIRQTGSQRIVGSFNNAAVGTALGQANGIQALDRSRQVIALCGDGGFNMLMCEFLTAVHHKLAVKVVVYGAGAGACDLHDGLFRRAYGRECAMGTGRCGVGPSARPFHRCRWRAPCDPDHVALASADRRQRRSHALAALGRPATALIAGACSRMRPTHHASSRHFWSIVGSTICANTNGSPMRTGCCRRRCSVSNWRVRRRSRI